MQTKYDYSEALEELADTMIIAATEIKLLTKRIKRQELADRSRARFHALPGGVSNANSEGFDSDLNSVRVITG